ncbi:MAG: TlpA disulfide reductase family protein [Actinomycetota bacterium]
MLPLGCERPAEVKKAAIGQVAPEVGDLKLSGFAGQPVIVNFWASWCIPCRKEFPLFADATLKYPDLVVLGVVFDDSSKAAEGFMRQQGASWRAIADADGTIAKTYGVGRPPGIPQSFFVDSGGVLVARAFGELTEATLAANLNKIIPKKT